MVSIVFTQESGITIYNAPHVIFSIADDYYYASSYFIIYTHKPINDVINFLQSNNFQFNVDGQIIYVTKYQPGQTVQHIEAPSNDYNENENFDDENDNEADYDIEDEIDGEVDNDDCISNNPMSAYPTTAVTKDHIISIAANFVKHDEASAFSLYNSKIRELHRIYGTIVTLKRQINDLMKVIDKQEIVKKIFEDIEYLEKKCPIVDSIGFVKNEPEKLAIQTKEIITEDQPKYGRRIVGRLQIIIDLKYLYNIMPPDNNFIKMLTIRNLDRAPENWVCGHAFISNNEFNICLGEYIDHVFEAITSKNLSLLFDTLIRFIKHPNEEDRWGEKICLFPKADNYIEKKVEEV